MQRNLNKKKEKRFPAAGSFNSRQLAWYLLLPLVVLLCVLSPWKRTVVNFFAPYLSIGNAAASGVADQTIMLRSRKELAREVERLRKQNLELAMQNTVSKQLERENRQLRNMLKLSEPPGYDYLACDVLLRDPWNWNSGFTINRGSRDGLQPGLAVIAPEAAPQGRVVFLGVIESVSKHTAHVISVLNPEYSISALLPESGVVGFLNAGGFEHSGGNTASVGYLPANSTFALNEPLYTTGFEAAIPGGLWLGNLESIEQTSMPFGNRLYRRGTMRPAGNLEQLRTVVVARLKKPLQEDIYTQ